ncbi:ribonuclease P protein subunit p14-like [Bombus vancouverensis nearcticus]|uniref:Ribonuclease P protein subunit p14-like isoform X2 n=1 Tax=Bombus bifarius TaxID=103933 RepID=A0A6P8MAT1_9HYME|nr:ribonuclease P protein subunit p14-like isoform X2 [Bombus vancouverensis nearcticus]XP_033299745.1 ribonuclease P protein subunit p14-like isoform X2 [Bombus bifarius]
MKCRSIYTEPLQKCCFKFVDIKCESGVSVVCTMYYLDVSLILPDSPSLEITEVYLKKNILQSIKQLFGEEGTKGTIDILKFDSKEHRCVLRCTDDCYVRLRAALVVAGKYEGHTCIYAIHRASANLLSFSANSRNYQH